MFRPMRRIKQQVSDDECKRVFKRECRFSSCFVEKILLHKYNESTYNKNIKRR